MTNAMDARGMGLQGIGESLTHIGRYTLLKCRYSTGDPHLSQSWPWRGVPPHPIELRRSMHNFHAVTGAQPKTQHSTTSSRNWAETSAPCQNCIIANRAGTEDSRVGTRDGGDFPGSASLTSLAADWTWCEWAVTASMTALFFTGKDALSKTCRSEARGMATKDIGGGIWTTPDCFSGVLRSLQSERRPVQTMASISANEGRLILAQRRRRHCSRAKMKLQRGLELYHRTASGDMRWKKGKSHFLAGMQDEARHLRERARARFDDILSFGSHINSSSLPSRLATALHCTALTHSRPLAPTMKSWPSLTAALATASLPLLASADSILAARQGDSCALREDHSLCPQCDGKNATDSKGQKWSITCDWVIDSETEQELAGHVSWPTCLDACDDADQCVGVNFAANGSCTVASGEQQGLRWSAGFTNLVTIATLTSTSRATSTSHVRITETLSGTHTRASTTSTSAPASASATALSASCSLDDPDICPKCNGLIAVDSNDKTYRVLCDTSIESNGSYSVQEWLSPEECLLECDKLDFCTGATYHGERSCLIAKADPSATYHESFTAFFPVIAGYPETKGSPSSSKTQAWNASTATATPEPTFSTLPINPGCDTADITCPECQGAPYTDKLNGSYTIFCGLEPTCMSTSVHRDPGTQDLCTESCDQAVTCLAAMWYPDTKACHLCLQGINKTVERSDVPYVLLVVDNDGDDDEGDATLSIASTASATASSRRGSITAQPSPFPSRTSTIGPVGPVSVASMPPLRNTTTSSPAPSSTTTSPSLANVTCPEYDDNVYTDANGNYFAVGCDSRFDAAHSRFISASDFAACVASCTGSCDGIQFGITTRCGLFTDISVVGPATGWTIAASITFPITTGGLPASITSVSSFAETSGPVPSTTSFTSSRTNGTVSWTSPAVTKAAPAPMGYESAERARHRQKFRYARLLISLESICFLFRASRQKGGL
ncbi:uncharacterized protein MYCFIDRAFT_175209 [Pseudocercospora fijiensis CIRAD86]|uniref:Uncharacterized protein n=1 Tax=Pseudocercospora fijiensis (strain CIRAD86) TaxID=383855 RepID=M3AAJ1_PSEFD|nr:uncharacterized protein MYCFIDRAFT_175209 [Pseudocercospora fijiensis CIRAD86]EME81616.1 hypothetical protein MYCFIDRAFT_175209 [Pseudocercospora fijiensis CIRAD86]